MCGPYLQTQRLLEEGGDNDQKRSWFQDHEERLLVKQSQLLASAGKDKLTAIARKDQKGKNKSKSQRKRELTVCINVHMLPRFDIFY